MKTNEFYVKFVFIVFPHSPSPPPHTHTHTAPPLPPLEYNDQSSSNIINYGLSGVNLEVRDYTGRVTWWYNGAPIPTDGSSQKYSISSDMVTLTVRDIVLSDAGLYQAELTDAEPTQFSNFQIDVRKSTKL